MRERIRQIKSLKRDRPAKNKVISIYRNCKIPEIILRHFDLNTLIPENYDLQ